MLFFLVDGVEDEIEVSFISSWSLACFLSLFLNITFLLGVLFVYFFLYNLTFIYSNLCPRAGGELLVPENWLDKVFFLKMPPSRGSGFGLQRNNIYRIMPLTTQNPARISGGNPATIWSGFDPRTLPCMFVTYRVFQTYFAFPTCCNLNKQNTEKHFLEHNITFY